MTNAEQLIDEAVNEAPSDAEGIYSKFEKTRDTLYKYIDQLAKAGEDPKGAAHRMYDDLSGVQVQLKSKLKLKR